MRNLRWGSLIAGLCVFTSAHAITADELVQKNIEARGGLAAIHAIASLRTEGKLRVGGGLELKQVDLVKAPDKARDEITFQGLTQISAYDGKQAWQISPFEGRKDPQKLSADDSKQLVEAADLAGPLVDYKAKGNHIEYLGTEDIDGTDAHKLKVTRPNGDYLYVYLDPDYFLEIREINHRHIRGQDDVSTVDVGEYEKVNGVYFPFSTEGNGTQIIEKAEANVNVDETVFAFPSAAPAAAKTH